MISCYCVIIYFPCYTYYRMMNIKKHTYFVCTLGACNTWPIDQNMLVCQWMRCTCFRIVGSRFTHTYTFYIFVVLYVCFPPNSVDSVRRQESCLSTGLESPHSRNFFEYQSHAFREYLYICIICIIHVLGGYIRVWSKIRVFVSDRFVCILCILYVVCVSACLYKYAILFACVRAFAVRMYAFFI